jgi:hypothetical protein
MRFPAGNPARSALASLVWLEAYATTFRYTLPSGQVPKSPESGKLANAFKDIVALINRLSAHFGIEMDDENSAALNVQPMRFEK